MSFFGIESIDDHSNPMNFQHESDYYQRLRPKWIEKYDMEPNDSLPVKILNTPYCLHIVLRRGSEDHKHRTNKRRIF